MLHAELLVSTGVSELFLSSVLLELLHSSRVFKLLVTSGLVELLEQKSVQVTFQDDVLHVFEDEP